MNTNAIDHTLVASEFIALAEERTTLLRRTRIRAAEAGLRSIRKCEQCPQLIEQQDTEPEFLAMPRLCATCTRIASVTHSA